MRTKISKWLLGLLLVAGSPAGAEPATANEAETRAFVAKTCAGCHPGPKLGAMVRRRLERGPLAEFLATHHVPDAAQREAVARYLERTAAAAPEAAAP